ncbi:MAG: hypothetical protein KGI71_04195 [Patescibacteria group bacterium]|nr:hypothetical protein [Patescibacteria group bacterium]
MTTETERRVPEHPGWQPHMLRLTEYNGCMVSLIDLTVYRTSTTCRAWWDDGYAYAVGTGPIPCDDECPEHDKVHYAIVGEYHDLADAEAAFAEACERLREGG